MRKSNFNYCFGFAATVLFAVLTAASASAVVVDTFDMVDPNQLNLELFHFDDPGTKFSTYQAPPTMDIVGGVRDVTLTHMSGFGSTDIKINAGGTSSGGGTSVFSFASDPGVSATANLKYDKSMSPVLNPSGLGGVDFTDGGTSNGLAMLFPQNDKLTEFVVTIWQDATTASQYIGEVPAVSGGDPAYDKFLPFSEFVKSEKLDVGGSALQEFTSVGAVEIDFFGNALDIQMDFVGTQGRGVSSASAVPEPASAVSFLIGALGLCYCEVFRQRRKRRSMR